MIDRLTVSELRKLSRWPTPAVYNGWEQVTSRDSAADCFNLEPVTDYMPHLGPMVGYAVTVQIEPSNPEHPERNPEGWNEYRRYVASVDGPKIVVVQDLDKPRAVGAFWGEVNTGIHRALGCVGTVTDGAVRDVEEMADLGFKALARCLCVGHANSHPVRWDCPVEAFGRTIRPGQLIHADRHGFLIIPAEDRGKLLGAVRFMDACECETVIPAGQHTAGKTKEQIVEDMAEAGRRFHDKVSERYGREGEH